MTTNVPSFATTLIVLTTALPAIAAVELPRGDPSQAAARRINVADFGASLADDERDDTPAVSAAIKAATNNRTLYFPAGTYNVKWVAEVSDFIWYNCWAGEDRLNQTVIRGNRLYVDGPTRPLVMIQRDNQSVGLVVADNTVHPYTAPPGSTLGERKHRRFESFEYQVSSLDSDDWKAFDCDYNNLFFYRVADREPLPPRERFESFSGDSVPRRRQQVSGRDWGAALHRRGDARRAPFGEQPWLRTFCQQSRPEPFPA